MRIRLRRCSARCLRGEHNAGVCGLNDVVENQGKLFDFVAQQYPDKDTEAFINTYMASKTRKSLARLEVGKALAGFMPDWIGEFYA